MDDRLARACLNLRVAPADLLEALCSLAGRPSPPSGSHPVRRVHEHVLHTAASLPLGALQPGDVSAATEVRAGLLNADVPPPSDPAARCIQHTVDDLGPADLWTLARGTAMTCDEPQATCPRGDTSTWWSPATPRGTKAIVIKFDKETCRPCPRRVTEQAGRIVTSRNRVFFGRVGWRCGRFPGDMADVVPVEGPA